MPSFRTIITIALSFTLLPDLLSASASYRAFTSHSRPTGFSTEVEGCALIAPLQWCRVLVGKRRDLEIRDGVRQEASELRPLRLGFSWPHFEWKLHRNPLYAPGLSSSDGRVMGGFGQPTIEWPHLVFTRSRDENASGEPGNDKPGKIIPLLGHDHTFFDFPKEISKRSNLIDWLFDGVQSAVGKKYPSVLIAVGGSLTYLQKWDVIGDLDIKVYVGSGIDRDHVEDRLAGLLHEGSAFRGLTTTIRREYNGLSVLYRDRRGDRWIPIELKVFHLEGLANEVNRGGFNPLFSYYGSNAALTDLVGVLDEVSSHRHRLVELYDALNTDARQSKEPERVFRRIAVMRLLAEQAGFVRPGKSLEAVMRDALDPPNLPKGWDVFTLLREAGVPPSRSMIRGGTIESDALERLFLDQVAKLREAAQLAKGTLSSRAADSYAADDKDVDRQAQAKAIPALPYRPDWLSGDLEKQMATEIGPLEVRVRTLFDHAESFSSELTHVVLSGRENYEDAMAIVRFGPDFSRLKEHPGIGRAFWTNIGAWDGVLTHSPILQLSLSGRIIPEDTEKRVRKKIEAFLTNHLLSAQKTLPRNRYSMAQGDYALTNYLFDLLLAHFSVQAIRVSRHEPLPLHWLLIKNPSAIKNIVMVAAGTNAPADWREEAAAGQSHLIIKSKKTSALPDRRRMSTAA